MNGSSKRHIRAALLLAAALATSQGARASTITATGVDSSRGQYGVWINADGVDENTYFAGVIFIRLSDGTSLFDRDTLCVDLFTDIMLGQTYGTTVVRPSDVPNSDLERVSALVDNALLPTQNGNAYGSLMPQADWVTTAAQGAGIQLAVWDIVHDGGDGFASGRVQAGSAANPTDPLVLFWAQTYEALSAGQTSNRAFIYTNVSLSNGQPAQMLAGPEFYTDGGPQPAPESATLLTAGSVLIAASLFGRKRILARQSR